MQEIAALCVARNSVYKSLLGVACYDDVRDGWTWHEWEGRKQTNDAAPEVLIVRN